MNVSQWITQELIARGVSHVFTLQGGYSQFINDAVGHSALKPVYMLTEAGAAYAAAGWAQYTGQMGVLCVTSGLAQTNALSGVASAYSDFLPMFVISGDIRSGLIIKRDTEGLRQGGQQDVPILKIAAPITKSVRIIGYSRRAPKVFSESWRLAMKEPRGPVWIDIPINIQQEAMPE